MSVNEIRDLIFEIFYKFIGFSKENCFYSIKLSKKKDLLLLATKLVEKIPDPGNAKNTVNL